MESIKRVHFFDGKTLTPEDLKAEQDYHLAKQQARNLSRFGRGVVSGLRVSIDTAGFRVSPGFGVDHLGREIIVQDAVLVPYGTALKRAYLVLRYKETASDPTPAPTWGEVVYTRIEEGFQFGLQPIGPIEPELIVLAELEQTAHGWRVVPPPASRVAWLMAITLGVIALLSCVRRR